MMKRVTATNLAEALYLSLEDAEESNHATLLKNFVVLLSKKHMLGKSEEILQAYQALVAKKEKHIEAIVTLKERLDKNTLHTLAEALKKRYNAKEIAVIEKIDTRIVGGMKIQVGDTLFDRTLKNNLAQLALQLTK